MLDISERQEGVADWRLPTELLNTHSGLELIPKYEHSRPPTKSIADDLSFAPLKSVHKSKIGARMLKAGLDGAVAKSLRKGLVGTCSADSNPERGFQGTMGRCKVTTLLFFSH